MCYITLSRYEINGKPEWSLMYCTVLAWLSTSSLPPCPGSRSLAPANSPTSLRQIPLQIRSPITHLSSRPPPKAEFGLLEENCTTPYEHRLPCPLEAYLYAYSVIPDNRYKRRFTVVDICEAVEGFTFIRVFPPSRSSYRLWDQKFDKVLKRESLLLQLNSGQCARYLGIFGLGKTAIEFWFPPRFAPHAPRDIFNKATWDTRTGWTS